MLLSDFDYNLPNDLIATEPLKKRDDSKLLVISQEISDEKISNFCEFVSPGDIIVLNNTKVIPSRFSAKLNSKKLDITLHKKISSNSWLAFINPLKKVSIGDKIYISDDFHCNVIEKSKTEATLKFPHDESFIEENINKYGRMPLPPYIEKQRPHQESDKDNYQTIYATNIGAVAAPTAGLHFTEEIFEKIKQKGADIVFVTLHVGAGTFLPVKTENVKEHKMHSEYAILTKESAEKINIAKRNGGKVICVGTTSLRILETVANEKGYLKAFEGETDIFITPGYKFKIVDKLLTNFHMPKSTLFMLVSAFSGLDKMKMAYAHAIERKYRFYSYGDACLLSKEN